MSPGFKEILRDNNVFWSIVFSRMLNRSIIIINNIGTFQMRFLEKRCKTKAYTQIGFLLIAVFIQLEFRELKTRLINSQTRALQTHRQNTLYAWYLSGCVWQRR